MLKPHPELAGEDVSVIFVKHTDNTKIRKIFNKVNRYARQTRRSDNIITSDDDIFAVISRKLISTGAPLSPVNGIDIVNWKNNTLSERSKQLTTLSALYTISETLLKDYKYSSKVMPSTSEVEEAYRVVADFWNVALKNLSAFASYMDLTQDDKPISDLRRENLLLKPVTQMALAHTARMAAAKGIALVDVIQRLNKINWSFKNELWFNILVIPSTKKKMITGKEAIRGAGMVISYLVMGKQMSKDEIKDVHQIIKNAKNDEKVKLPNIIDD